MKQNRIIVILLLLFAVLMSLPFLVPGCGMVSLVALVPLLCAERIAGMQGVKRFFWWYYAAFVVFNAITTWWVCKATVGGGIFAVMANAFYMSVIFTLFRLSKKCFGGSVPYILLAVAWIAWERFYLTLSQISWPWLVFGNAFARTTTLVQWYEYTGLLGGSLWVWVVNLGIFGIMTALSDGSWMRWNAKAKRSSLAGLLIVIAGPIVCSKVIYRNYEEKSEGKLDVVMAQSNFNPYEKLENLPQRVQNQQVIDLFNSRLKGLDTLAEYPSDVRLLLIPETFCSDIWLNDPAAAPTWNMFTDSLIRRYPNINLIFGASTHKLFNTKAAPSILARRYGRDAWYQSYNSAFILDISGRVDRIDKTKLVVGSELTPYPRIFAPLDDRLGGLMGRCVPQGEARLLTVKGRDAAGNVNREVPVGVPICYESIYPEFCTQYVRKGAQLICVITNDGWWGDTAGYRQHFSYSRLRAIELRRDIARCANTGISGYIDQRGDVLEQSRWWTPDVMEREVNLNSEITFFVRYGDIIGRVCTMLFCMLFLGLIVKSITRKP